MKTKIVKSKYRFLVLFDQTKSSYTALNDAVNMAKVVNAGIDILYVKSPIEVARHDNQIAVMRTMNTERATSKKKMQKLVNTIADLENIPIIYSFTFGNVITEIQKHITRTQPDVVVIGKRKNKIVNFLGDGLTSYLLKNHKGNILISGNEKNLKSYHNVSLGFLDDISISNEVEITQDLKKNSIKPFSLFKIKKTNNLSEKGDSEKESPALEVTTNTTVFEFEEGVDNSSSLSKYIEKNNVGLLCIKRTKEWKPNNFIGPIHTKIKRTINKTNVAVLILAN
ncbi:universal stress protein [Aquimarina longa]|uniref:universal stress protein n=1 Tax=Aquimarina longa TaxID=1080221 RepID=UPI000783483D|nr:universal stress protein [Aquimarina longa]